MYSIASAALEEKKKAEGTKSQERRKINVETS
jgi:hypothetical protein